ncbi:hypothetical protein, partial [Burkholderia cepacia]|uniref:hypothetical protein n=1 Tax=Burkholderia cepacia TaxID=292 RepID=UPI001E56D2DF
RESGHFYVAQSGHFNLATTTDHDDNSRYVKSHSKNCHNDPGARQQRNKPEIPSFKAPARVIQPPSPRIMPLAPGVTNDPVQMLDLPGGIARLALQQLRQRS